MICELISVVNGNFSYSFLLLLPRQIMSEGVGTCYEEYVQDANRHYQNWILKTVDYNWPTEAKCPSASKTNSTTDLNRECIDEMHIYVQVQSQSVPIFYRIFSASCGQPCPSASSSSQANNKKELHCNDSGISEGNFYEGPLLRLLFSHVRNMSSYAYELNLAVIAILSKLAFLPHPYLHEILLNPELPIAKGTNTLWSSMQFLARQLLLEVPRIEGFQKRIAETGKNLLINPPMMRLVSLLICWRVFVSFLMNDKFTVKPRKTMIRCLKHWLCWKSFVKN